MPLVKSSTFPGPPFYLFNGHLETFYPPLVRRVEGLDYERERYTLKDGDFVDIDWILGGNNKLILLTHGLEGNTDRHYIKGMGKLFVKHGYDVLAWNCRSCSGEMNLKLRMYNHGEIEDIGELIDYAIDKGRYRTIVLAGFSMGGSITLKYLGVHGKEVPQQIKAAIAFSTPCDLHSSVALLDEPRSRIYKNRFLSKLKPKMAIKARQFPDVINFDNIRKVKKWKDFDNYFSAPINGYKDADDFYTQASCINYLEGIKVPSLLVNAKNDPILTPECFPYDLARNHECFYFESPELGGHVSFSLDFRANSWAEKRGWKFVSEVIGSD